MTMAPVNDTVNEATGRAARRAASGLPRLLPLVPGVPEDLRAHLARYGRPPSGNPDLIRIVEQAGLTGRGGAAFPVHRKLAIVARARGRKVIVANGAESEPASRKDAVLLRAAPNLVLDGLQLAAEAIGASEAHLYLHPGISAELLRALNQRAAAGLDRLAVTITEAPPRFLAGQESALVSRLGGGPAVPAFVPPRVSERGLGGAPTLVQNVETLAHLALIARYGPRWFRAVGTANEPGSMLATVHTTRQHAGLRGRDRRLAKDPATQHGERPGRPHRRLPRRLAAHRHHRHPHPGQRGAEQPTAPRSAPASSPRCPPTGAAWPRRPGSSATWPPSRPASAGRASTACPGWPPPWPNWPDAGTAGRSSPTWSAGRAWSPAGAPATTRTAPSGSCAAR